MKKLYTIILLAFVCTIANAQSGNWLQKPNFGGAARTGAVGFKIINKGYIGMGLDIVNYYQDFWEYDTSGVWTQKANFPGQVRAYATGFGLDGVKKGYIGLGKQGTTYYQDFWSWSQTTNMWTQIANFPGTGREGAVAFTYDQFSYAYVGTGNNGSTYFNDFYKYDGSSWTAVANFPGAARSYAVGFSLGVTSSQNGYVGTGTNGSTSYNDFYEYKWGTNTWTAKTNFPGNARYASVGFGNSGSGKGYIGLGKSSLSYYYDFWEYNKATNSWTQITDFTGTARESAAGFCIGNDGYVGTGFDGSGSYTNDFWKWTILPWYWVQRANVPISGRAWAIGFSIGTKGYFGTGGYSGPYYKDLWEWNQATNTWAQMADFPSDARFGAIGFSIGTKGYIGTGFGTGGTSYERSDFYEWDQTTNTWVQKANYPGNNYNGIYNAVGFSIGTKGYIGTGQATSLPNSKEFWEWDQTTNVWTRKADYLGGYNGQGARYAFGFAIGTKGYIGTGATSCPCTYNSQKDFWSWDQATNIWSQKQSFPGGKRQYASSFTIGNYGYAGLGENDSICSCPELTDFYRYNPALNIWDQTCSPLIAGGGRTNATGFSIGNQGYIAAGSTQNSGTINDLWEYTNGITITTATDEIKNSYTAVSVYPNPSNGKFTLSSEITKGEITVYNVEGEKIYQLTNQQLNNSIIDLSSQPNGIYFLQLKISDGVAVKKLIINR